MAHHRRGKGQKKSSSRKKQLQRLRHGNPHHFLEIFQAAQNSDPKHLKECLDTGGSAYVNFMDSFGNTPLVYALSHPKALRHVQLLLSAGAWVTQPSHEAFRRLYAAVGFDDFKIPTLPPYLVGAAQNSKLPVEEKLEIFRLLLEKGVKINQRSPGDGKHTALSKSLGSTELVEFLLNQKASPILRINSGESILALAIAEKANPDTLRLLFSHSPHLLFNHIPNLEEKESDIQSLLHLAAAFGMVEALQILVDEFLFPVNLRRPKINQNQDSALPLELAMRFDHLEAVQFLLRRGALVDDDLDLDEFREDIVEAVRSHQREDQEAAERRRFDDILESVAEAMGGVMQKNLIALLLKFDPRFFGAADAFYSD